MRLLLAEDEKELTKALEIIFKHNNYSIDIAYNGKEACDFADTNKYDVIILDIMMPVMDGITALKTLRSKGVKTPIIMLTAKSQLEDKVLGLDAGADDYLAKPFSTQELLARIRALSRRNEATTVTNNIVLGNTTIDLVNYDVSTAQGKTNLTSKEFQLLVEFVKNPSRIYPVSDLLDKIWGFDGDVYDDIVWVNISYLRKKLKDISSNIEIKSKRNMGYYVEVGNV